MSISNSLALTESHLTFEFIQECMGGYKKSNNKMRFLCLDYMSPWLRNLGKFCCNKDHKDGLAKVNDILRLLIEVTLDKQEVCRKKRTILTLIYKSYIHFLILLLLF